MPYDNIDLRATTRLPGLGSFTVVRLKATEKESPLICRRCRPLRLSVVFWRQLTHLYFGPKLPG